MSTAPRWAGGQGWRLEEIPEVTIGVVEGDERYLLHDVYQVRRMSEGRIAVLDAGSARVRVYAGDGAHLFDVGGRGDGPAEFRSPQFLTLAEDSIVVFERSPGSATWFTPGGAFVRRVATPGGLDGRSLYPLVVGVLADGRAVVAAAPPGRERPGQRIHRPSMAVWTFPLRGTEADSLFSFLDREQEYYQSDGRPSRRDVIFGHRSYVTAGEDQIYHGTTESYSINVYDGTGSLRRVIRKPGPASAVTDAHLDRLVDWTADRAGLEQDRRDALKRSFRDGPVNDSLPAFRLLVVDAEANLWVENWAGAGMRTESFSVFSPEGEWLGDVTVPTGLSWLRGSRTNPIEIGSDYVLGVWEGDLGVQQVRLYRLLKD
ncbi:hypothetical protein HQ520_16165 [bacterium]|nr:hypothetical protein [bacterium]